MLPPIEGNEDYYELCLEYSIGGEKQKEPMRVKMKRDGGFAKGQVYNISVKVRSPQEIFATATLSSWGSPIDVTPYTVEE